MLFNSLDFFIFLPIVLVLYFVLPLVGRHILLLAASLYFYMYWNIPYVSLILFTAVVDWSVAVAMDRSTTQRRKRQWLLFSLIANLGVLAVFKYYNFFVDTLDHLGAPKGFLPWSDLLLPLGISFHTFQSLSYTIDVYRGKFPAERSFFRVLLFVVFFPQLVAGPIERGAELLPQFRIKFAFEWDNLIIGSRRILNGLIKKSVIADNLAPWVDAAYSSPGTHSGPAMLLATYAYAIRIYCDFSGYSDIAVGTARIMGFRFIENFRRPYLSRSIQEFWRRWHISLSTWLRDYLYISLGGSRGSAWLTYRNLILTMVLGGLWHGASWTFVVWGAFHGAWLAIERFVTERRGARPRDDDAGYTIGDVLRVFLVFHGVCLGWIFFVSPDMATAWAAISRIVTFAPGEMFGGFSWWKTLLIVAAGSSYFVLAELADRQRAWLWWIVGVLGLLVLALFATSSHEFIYFVF